MGGHPLLLVCLVLGMYATEFDIVRWLSSIPDLQNHPIPRVSEPDKDETDYAPPRKRQKLANPQRGIPSPTISDSSSRKRRFSDLDDHHASLPELDRPLDDTTPRPGRFLQSQQILQTEQLGWIPYSVEQGRDTPSVTSRASSHSVATSGRSGRSKQDSASNRSSPSKQLRNAEMNDTGFTVGSFVLEPQPESLRKLRIELRDFGSGYGVCPASMKDEMLAKDPELPRYAFDNTEAPCPSTSAIPPFDWVEDLVRRAIKCRIDRECEASWNGDVHAPILEQVFRTGRFSSIDMVDFRWCPTAQILQSFRPQKAPSKMVDFCVFVCPGEGTSEESIIKNLCQKRPGQSINHTDLGNFCKHPIVLSIETKRPGEHGDNAMLQIGTWHSAQWRSLRYEQDRSSRSIEFLPGIIIQGHEWRFVASVLDVSSKCQLLEAVALGNTGSTLGVYSLMASLQRLRRWIKEEYWQAFVSDILM